MSAELLPTASWRETRRAAVDLLRARRFGALGAILALVASTVVGLATPAVLGMMVNVVTDGGDGMQRQVTLLALLLVGVAVGQAVFGAASDFLIARVGQGTIADLREKVVHRTLLLPQSLLERSGRGDVVSRVTSDVRLVTRAVSNAVPVFAGAGLTIGLTVVGLAGIDWRFAVAALIAAPIQIHSLRWYLRRSAPVYRQEREAEGERAQQTLDSLGNTDTVFAFRLSDPHLDRIGDRSLTAVRLSLLATRLRTRFFGRLNMAEFIGLSAVLVVAFVLVRRGDVSLGAATAAALYFFRLFDPIGSALTTFDELQEGGIALARLVGVTLIPLPPVSTASPADGSISLREVSFRYDGAKRYAVHDLSLEISAGTHMAVVGASGAGKSTLARLIAGIHEPSGGIDIGGVARQTISSRSIALVTQEVHVFAGTIRQDMHLVDPGADESRLRSALASAGALGWVDALDDGLDTVVGSGGRSLTAAAAQQLALARVALLDPTVLILDEATAEAGSAGAQDLDDAVARLAAGRTTITVAHRLSQAEVADVVVVMDGGRVVEQGSHDELLSGGGAYAKLWAAWSAGRQAESVSDHVGSARSGATAK
ncbi:ABC transporter ATP-binding protein [Rhodococcoides kyotonense]|uniref:ATP-binding cassette, subfamily C n=1 Tax=Rhodococcoides kyotonense TaxID=398843 RepID=A0A239L7L1_9NOCA|nr:ABC transporter ATP-binding protein [Rhodococcus kyotonensis]SNT25843.1 ATP-binding cassette, subfamily C [Rhodococcus kyotonensis]